MRGSIFVPLRRFVTRKSEEHSWFFGKVEEMLGCLMCTATEATLWTFGLTTFVIGFSLGMPKDILSAIVRHSVSLPWPFSIFLMGAISFALSLAIAGEAWAIKTIVEHREEKFLALRNEFRDREIELLGEMGRIQTGGKPSLPMQAIIPYADFAPLYKALKNNSACKKKSCPFWRTECHITDIEKGIAAWWQKTNERAPGFHYYRIVFDECLMREDDLYFCFWSHGMKPCKETYDMLLHRLRAVFEREERSRLAS